MTRTQSLRGLLLAAALTLVLLPLVALGGGLIVIGAANLSVIEAAPEQLNATQAAVTDLLGARWEQMQANSRSLDALLATLQHENQFALEVRDLENRVLFASPGVEDGEYHSPGGIQAEPNVRVAQIRRGGQTLGVAVLWIWPRAALGGLKRAAAGGFLAAGLTLVVLLAVVLRWTGRAILAPLLALERATVAVADGSLEFAVPQTHVRELASLGSAFGTMRDRLRASLERQQAMEAERRRFLAAIGHDLRTPLSSVQAFAEGLRDGLARNPEKAARYASVILDKTREMNRLVEDLFAFARLDLPETAIQPERLEGARYLSGVVSSFEPAAAAKGVALRAEGPDLPLTADPELLARALGNLLSNALRHTPPGGSITVAWAPSGGGVGLTVSDTGEGIPPEELPYLFSPMHRTDRSRNRRSGGAGLGLAITARIVQLHGGQIACESIAGQGTTFTLSLPAGRTQ